MSMKKINLLHDSIMRATGLYLNQDEMYTYRYITDGDGIQKRIIDLNFIKNNPPDIFLPENIVYPQKDYLIMKDWLIQSYSIINLMNISTLKYMGETYVPLYYMERRVRESIPHDEDDYDITTDWISAGSPSSPYHNSMGYKRGSISITDDLTTKNYVVAQTKGYWGLTTGHTLTNSQPGVRRFDYEVLGIFVAIDRSSSSEGFESYPIFINMDLDDYGYMFLPINVPVKANTNPQSAFPQILGDLDLPELPSENAIIQASMGRGVSGYYAGFDYTKLHAAIIKYTFSFQD